MGDYVKGFGGNLNNENGEKSLMEQRGIKPVFLQSRYISLLEVTDRMKHEN